MNKELELGAFHLANEVCFRRLKDGSVKISQNGEEIVTTDEAGWASAVCSVSMGGENSERWMQARRFHGLEEDADA